MSSTRLRNARHSRLAGIRASEEHDMFRIDRLFLESLVFNSRVRSTARRSPAARFSASCQNWSSCAETGAQLSLNETPCSSELPRALLKSTHKPGVETVQQECSEPPMIHKTCCIAPGKTNHNFTCPVTRKLTKACALESSPRCTLTGLVPMFEHESLA